MAVLVTDSISLMFFRLRPHKSWCMEGSKVVASTILPSYRQGQHRLYLSWQEELRAGKAYKLINVDKHAGLSMLR